ncbi:copper resistance CopC family protein [Paeniglutamicibacter cryotolerans]|uniref:CopC domain-containing protein n=1 Tax=Paeniglutamicibacter cryotolerans TaxID=670079 RepID=A0A839QMP8_9MICC|nr:copper resistance CopC family protein [Paeniglutamicibacter cryotolerans]MBB2997050.1 hypothetical protein [Paeniglutamicibacter cryotolerans]
MAPPALAHRPLRFVLRTLLAVTVLAAVFVPASAAQAHDVLEGTSPAYGSTVATVPAAIGLTFSHTPMAIGAVILVNDATGTNWAAGPVAIVDNQASQRLNPGAPAGTYTVKWRVVSSDSHPIQGTFTFTALSPSKASGQASNAPLPSPEANAPLATTQVAPIPWVFIGAGVGLLTLVVVVGIGTKRMQGRSDNVERTDESQEPKNR